MKIEAVSLNLSRKWRSQTFDQIIGQDLSIRILKNSLYANQFFPVYLFLGQRGCGKTSTARVFAAAINCKELIAFQKNFQLPVPCLTCSSCSAMREGKHPDFIEIDAASHTGVDHMRTIIESSTLLPIIGRKRVYLIDEAHMLSKAAFNAALKILEEPPATALFILATTNPHKIIDTVKSRCFQLFFTPIAHDSLKSHLQNICQKEAISYDDDALDIIVRHTQGSARDALNIVEQIRFSSTIIDQKAVLQLLGHINDQHITDIIKVVLQGSATQLLDIMHYVTLEHYAADFVWQRLMILLRALVWIKHGINPRLFISSDAELKEIARTSSLPAIHRVISSLYENEELFFKTSSQHALLEMILLHLCQKDKTRSDNNGGSAPCSVGTFSTDISDQEDDETAIDEESTKQEQEKRDDCFLWQRFVEHIMKLNEPVLSSLFRQAAFIDYDQHKKRIIIECPKDLILFKEWLENTCTVWRPLLKKIFSADVELETNFVGTHSINHDKNIYNNNLSAHNTSQRSATVASQVTQSQEKELFSPARERLLVKQHYKKKSAFIQQSNEKVCDVSDENKWKIASMLLRHFPGVVTEIRENR